MTYIMNHFLGNGGPHINEMTLLWAAISESKLLLGATTRHGQTKTCEEDQLRHLNNNLSMVRLKT